MTGVSLVVTLRVDAHATFVGGDAELAQRLAQALDDAGLGLRVNDVKVESSNEHTHRMAQLAVSGRHASPHE